MFLAIEMFAIASTIKVVKQSNDIYIDVPCILTKHNNNIWMIIQLLLFC